MIAMFPVSAPGSVAWQPDPGWRLWHGIVTCWKYGHLALADAAVHRASYVNDMIRRRDAQPHQVHDGLDDVDMGTAPGMSWRDGRR
jgi:hypothetical protein